MKKHVRRNRRVRRALMMAAALVLVAMISVGGTIAWLTSVTGPVVNTFTVGDINITLTETTGPNYKVTPGVDIKKDPVVTFTEDSEKCWLFVKIEEGNWHEALTYNVNSAWTALDGEEGVYYMQLDADEAETGAKYYVLAGKTGMSNGYVAVDGEKLTEAEMEKLESNNPTLTFTAYAIQQEGFETAADAWTEVSKN